MEECWDIYQYMLFLSSDRGDNIKLMFALSSRNPEDAQERISTFLYHLVDNYPSVKVDTEMKLMDAYWNYKFDDKEKDIVSQLLKEISRKYTLTGIKSGFHNMCVLICQQLNVSDMASVIGILRIWCKNRIMKNLISNN